MTHSEDDNNVQSGQGGGKGSAGDEVFQSRLRDLNAKLTKVSRKHAPPAENRTRGSALGLAFRLAVELVAGLVVGGGIGWLLDKWLGTSPLFLLVFFALGTAAGILNVFRTARQMQVPATGTAISDDDDD